MNCSDTTNTQLIFLIVQNPKCEDFQNAVLSAVQPFQ
jgi:hypothetical protein